MWLKAPTGHSEWEAAIVVWQVAQTLAVISLSYALQTFQFQQRWVENVQSRFLHLN